MAIFSSIRRIIPSVSTVVTKGAGITALALVARDANYVGKMQADLYASEKDAKSTAYYLNNTLYGNMSKTQEKIRNFSYNMELNQTWKRFFNEGIGYVKGFSSMLVSNFVPLALGAGALLGRKSIAKVSTGALAIYAGYEFVKNFFGMGTPNNLKLD